MIVITTSQKIEYQQAGHIASMLEDEQMDYYKKHSIELRNACEYTQALKEELDTLSEGLHLTDIDITFMNEHKNYCKFIWTKYESN